MWLNLVSTVWRCCTNKTYNESLKFKVWSLKFLNGSNFLPSAFHFKLSALNFKLTFDGSPWYGTAVMPMLESIGPEVAIKQLKGRSILRLARHMLAWRTYVLYKLQGDDGFDIEMGSEADWPTDDAMNWSAVLEALNTNQTQLLEVLKTFPETKLVERVPGRQYTFRFMLEGMVQHDVYHLGQIALLKNLVG